MPVNSSVVWCYHVPVITLSHNLGFLPAYLRYHITSCFLNCVSQAVVLLRVLQAVVLLVVLQVSVLLFRSFLFTNVSLYI